MRMTFKEKFAFICPEDSFADNKLLTIKLWKMRFGFLIVNEN